MALIDAARTNDTAMIRAIFGPGVAELESDSPEKTQGDLTRLAAAYDRRNQLLINSDASVTLAVGDDLWEFPVPIVRDGAPPSWRFDTAVGVAFVRQMRFDDNAASAADFLLACIPAQEEFRRLNTGGKSEFARRFRSDRGMRNGLWWPDDLAPPISPLGPMVDEAVASEHPPVDPWDLRSYRGYRFRVLTAAGAAAPGGPANWLDASGALVGGYAFIAWPVSYGETGVQTLLVAMDGTIWSRDLGAETDTRAQAVVMLDPSGGWMRWDSGG